MASCVLGECSSCSSPSCSCLRLSIPVAGNSQSGDRGQAASSWTTNVNILRRSRSGRSVRTFPPVLSGCNFECSLAPGPEKPRGVLPAGGIVGGFAGGEQGVRQFVEEGTIKLADRSRRQQSPLIIAGIVAAAGTLGGLFLFSVRTGSQSSGDRPFMRAWSLPGGKGWLRHADHAALIQDQSKVNGSCEHQPG